MGSNSFILKVVCIILLSISILSGLLLMILVLTKILPHKKKKNISIRIPKLMTLYFYCTAWILIIAIPITSSLFCLIDDTTTIYNYIASISLTISIIPLIITHISRVGLLRIQHAISNATMAFNLGEITWNEFVNKFEIILQEDYSITKPEVVRKYCIYICFVLVAISVIIIIFTHPFFYIYTNCIWLGVVTILSALITNKFKLDAYSILKEMHYITIMFLIQFMFYVAVSFIKDDICTATILTNIVLCIGLSGIWIIQLRYSLRALVTVHRAVSLTQLLSSYDGYKAFLRFLVSELSIENLEYFQLSMRWRYRICCWLYGVENGTKQPKKDIKLPFKIFSFQYVDRLLPQQTGGGLVPNKQEKKDGAMPLNGRDSQVFFSTLPMSRKASVNTRFTSPYASNQNSRTTTPRFGAGDMVSGASAVHLPATIIEGNDGEEVDTTHTATATYMLPQQQSFDEHEYSTPPQHKDKNTVIEHLNKNHLQKSASSPIMPPKTSPRSKPVLSPLTMTAPQSMENDSAYYLHKIPHEDEIIDGMNSTAYTTIHHATTDTPSITDQPETPGDKQPILGEKSTGHSTPINSKPATTFKEAADCALTKAKATKTNTELQGLVHKQDSLLDDNDGEDGMEYIEYHKYQSPMKDTPPFNAVDDTKLNKKKAIRTVRFATKGTMQYLDDMTPDHSPQYKPQKGGIQITMNDLLETHRQRSLREESVASKAAEPSWFAAWFKKSNPCDGHEERANTMLHFSDLSWRRLITVSREVNMSATARNSVDVLFKEYRRSRYLEINGITLEEYDKCMCGSWVSCWENMQDSLRRFSKSVHYDKYLQSIGQLTITRLSEPDQTSSSDLCIENKMRVLSNDTVKHERGDAFVIK